MKSTRAAVQILVLLVIAAAGWLFLAKPKIFDGDSRRAKNSTEATARFDTATNAQGAAAAAGVVKIGEANAAAPDSPARNFIASEVPAVLSKLPAPDPQALLDAERRRAAVMEGRADEARRLYEQEAGRATRLQAERDAARDAQRAANAALSEHAAAQLAAERNSMLYGLAALAALALFAWVKFTHLSPERMGLLANDLRAGRDAIASLDFHAPSAYARTLAEKAAQLATDLHAPPTPPAS